MFVTKIIQLEATEALVNCAALVLCCVQLWGNWVGSRGGWWIFRSAKEGCLESALNVSAQCGGILCFRKLPWVELLFSFVDLNTASTPSRSFFFFFSFASVITLNLSPQTV